MITAIQTDTKPILGLELVGQKGGAGAIRLHGKATAETCLVLLDERVLDRQCLAQCLTTYRVGKDIVSFGSIDEWQLCENMPPASAVLLNLGSRKVSDAKTGDAIADLVRKAHPAPVAILADTDELEQILRALGYGAKAYIPSSLRFEICVEAINFVIAGGTFVPASSLAGLHKTIEADVEMPRPMASVFTERQEDVVQALRRGKANKIIAHELNLRESTVKVHIRNIMKKLKATNRTEAVYMLNEMFPGANQSVRAS
ncbi:MULTISPECIES: response regulator transcription factor [Mesorhizobium]|uniref:Transcriptional regulator, LuxR family n=1 Tax=Mesorhizobium opportunistum (strain LMG 24607 / HAMBI 3007 / WSM2075) TaxID=536019 RepID=F7Y6T8_MESOW|nr:MULTISPECIES: response regulator transcription factor [Mesorhizobium]AEH87408.1 transcriptional regulator, LuxR family [Mesorhizobium opportunistum WSM2075]MCA0030295.1 response regulator transcription factor [Mesorhizobium sp. B263B2A]